LGIPLATLSDEPRVDITIDGADEVDERNLNLIKGHGGALLREKIVAISSERLVIVIHESKLVKHLGVTCPYRWKWFLSDGKPRPRHLADLGTKPSLRRNPDGEPFRSDGGNYIIDCSFEPVVSVESLADRSIMWLAWWSTGFSPD